MGNTYIHASKKPNNPKKDARNVILNIGKVLFDIYGINSIDELNELETAYKDYPDICSGINFMLEVFLSPEDAKLGYLNVPSEQFQEKLKGTVGYWKGKWTCNEKIIEEVKLHIELKDDYLTASIEHSSIYNNRIFNIVEKLGIKFFEGYFQMQGYDNKIEPFADDMEYADNFFELEFLGNNILIGTHKCNVGNGKALFFRT